MAFSDSRKECEDTVEETESDSEDTETAKSVFRYAIGSNCLLADGATDTKAEDPRDTHVASSDNSETRAELIFLHQNPNVIGKYLFLAHVIAFKRIVRSC